MGEIYTIRKYEKRENMQLGPIILKLVKYDGLLFKVYLSLILNVNLMPTLSARFF